MSESGSWSSFEAGPRVLVTRAPEDARVLTRALALAGFEPVEVPLLQRIWEVDAVAAAARSWPPVDVVVVTSATTVDVLAVAAPRAFRDARWAAVGPATARRLQELGLPVHLVPQRSTGADLVEALGPVEGLRVAYPRADLALPDIADTLRDRGAEVLEVVAYTNSAPPGIARQLAEALPVDATTVLSGSAAERLADAVPPEHHHKLGQIVVIGPSTLAVARQVGLKVHAMADPYTVAGVVEALQRLFTR